MAHIICITDVNGMRTIEFMPDTNSSVCSRGTLHINASSFRSCSDEAVSMDGPTTIFILPFAMIP